MPDEAGTKATRSDSMSADDSLFGDAPAADDKPAAAVNEQDSEAGNEAEQQAAGDAGEKVAGDKTPQETKDSVDAGEPADDDAKATADAPVSIEDDLKVVVSIKGGRAVIGVQRPSSDPHIETFDDLDESGLTQEVSAVIERARTRCEDSPKHPAYQRPAPPARRCNRRQQGSAQDATTPAAGTEQAQQQTLALFQAGPPERNTRGKEGLNHGALSVAQFRRVGLCLWVLRQL